MSARIYHVHTAVTWGWIARREGSHRGSPRFWTKRRAVEYARGRKGWTEIVIHRTDGTMLTVLYPKPICAQRLRLPKETLAGRMVKRLRERTA